MEDAVRASVRNFASISIDCKTVLGFVNRDPDSFTQGRSFNVHSSHMCSYVTFVVLISSVALIRSLQIDRPRTRMDFHFMRTSLAVFKMQKIMESSSNNDYRNFCAKTTIF